MGSGKFRILLEDKEEGRLYKYAKVDWLDGGSGVLIYDYATGRKTSRHEDGKVWDRKAGAGTPTSPSTQVPFSDIEREQLRNVGLPSNITQDLELLGEDPGPQDITFSSTVLRASDATVAAEIVDDQNKDQVLESYQSRPDVVSAQTAKAMKEGKSLLLTVLNSSST